MTVSLATNFVLATNQIPIDVGAVIKFNGFVFNDRLSAREVARVTSIDGIMGTELKDSRGDNPSDEGDIAYPAHFGPKSVTLTGVLEAGSIPSITAMRVALGLATNDLVEHPLVFNRYDQLDSVSQEEFNRYWLGAENSNNLTISAGKLQKSTQNASVANAYRKTVQFTDARTTAKIAAPSSTVASANITFYNTQRVTPPSPSAGDYTSAYVIFAVGSSTATLGISYGDGTTETQTNGPTFTWTTAQNLWIRHTAIGNVLTAEVFSVDPFTNPTATALATQTLTIPAGANRTATGAGVYGYPGVQWSGNSAQTSTVTLDEYRVEGYNPCDVMFQRARLAQALGGAETQANYQVRRPFQAIFRASDPRLVSVPEYTASAVVTATNVQGRVFDETYDVSYGTYLDSDGVPVATSQLITAVNNGNYRSLPRVRLYGYLKNPTLTNNLTGQQLRILGEIQDNDYLEIDISRRTVVDSAGNSRFGIVDPASDVFSIAAGSNVIQLGADAFGGVQTNAAAVFVYYRSAWLL